MLQYISVVREQVSAAMALWPPTEGETLTVGQKLTQPRFKGAKIHFAQ